ncbi:MAG: class I SAM-dependent methyltransferase [Pirellula sp.]
MHYRYCILTGLRNASPLLPAFRDMVDRFIPSPTRVILGVNDSTDATLEMVQNWPHPNLDVFTFDTGSPYPPRTATRERTAHLALVRNRIIERALQYSDWDFALMLDASKLMGSECPKVLMDDGGDIVAPLSWHWKHPNSFWDTWCFRDIEGRPFRNQLLVPAAARIEVQAVGGVYMVKRSVLEQGCRLAETDGSGCDSVPFCEQARSKGFRVFIRTELRVTAFDYPNSVPKLGCINAITAAGDYVSPDLVHVRPDRCFPHIMVGDPHQSNWQYLRREIPHNWYVDDRHPTLGFLNRDEAHILFNSALPFRGKNALEIGCWKGWSAAHLAAAGVQLDVVDPILSSPEILETVTSSLRAGGWLSHVNLFPGYSPQKIEELAAAGKRWSLIFIDGNHEEPGPWLDAQVCEKYAEPDALVLFHDLASPIVARGLDYFQQKGWKTIVYCTTQIMGAAWRGNAMPIQHIPDPRVNWTLPNHLRNHPVSGASVKPS